MLRSPAMAAKKPPGSRARADFIRQRPSSMSVADVISKGKEGGLSFTSSLVYMVRGRQDGKARPKKAGGKTTASKKSGAKKTSSKRVSAATKKKTPKTSAASKTTAPKKTGETKADFVRQRGHLSPKEIVEDAKSKGLKLDASYVYNVPGVRQGDREQEAEGIEEERSLQDEHDAEGRLDLEAPGPERHPILGLRRGVAQGSRVGAGPWAGPGESSRGSGLGSGP